MSWWQWLLLGWMLASIPVALLIGRAIRIGQQDEACRSCSHGRSLHAEGAPAARCYACACPCYIRQIPNRPAQPSRIAAVIGRISLPAPRRPQT